MYFYNNLTYFTSSNIVIKKSKSIKSETVTNSSINVQPWPVFIDHSFLHI